MLTTAPVIIRCDKCTTYFNYSAIKFHYYSRIDIWNQ